MGLLAHKTEVSQLTTSFSMPMHSSARPAVRGPFVQTPSLTSAATSRAASRKRRTASLIALDLRLADKFTVCCGWETKVGQWLTSGPRVDEALLAIPQIC